MDYREKEIEGVGGAEAMGRHKAFTLIELLVVISIIALLMAILLPTLGRARKQGRAVRCQANLKQWGTVLAAYMGENDGLLPRWWVPNDGHRGDWFWGGSIEEKGILICPMASTPADTANTADKAKPIGAIGGTFHAWGLGGGVKAGAGQDSPSLVLGSYGWNSMIGGLGPSLENARYLRPQDVKYPANIPVIMDCAWPDGWLHDLEPPPPSDAIPTWTPFLWDSDWRISANKFCMNRHDGYVNGVFMDWSVRRVGLKELWTLTWLRDFNTHGPWTKAGGVRPEDWPEWMRKFKD